MLMLFFFSFMFLQPKPRKKKETGPSDKNFFMATLPPARIESGPSLKGTFTKMQNLSAESTDSSMQATKKLRRAQGNKKCTAQFGFTKVAMWKGHYDRELYIHYCTDCKPTNIKLVKIQAPTVKKNNK